MANIRELALDGERLAPGHRLCPGCGLSIIARTVMRGTKDPIVVATATGCLEVSTTIYPYTAWNIPWIHNAFENVAATISGVEAAYKVLKKKGKITKNVKFLAFGGDGGTYDIGLQSLSGALERGHTFVYVCVDNEGYMNTGIQRSSSTPYGAWTNTSAVGKLHQGKEQFKKDLTAVIAGHHIPYVAQASPHNYVDLLRKSEKAFNTQGPAFINVLSPCVPGWKYPMQLSVKLAKMAVDTCFWPLFEIENDVWTLNYDPGPNKKPMIEWLKMQGRFRHLLKPENAHIVETIQKNVDLRWEQIKKMCNRA
jgi:pyruvate ferredoxin oxidoreductase beta subunit